MGGVFAVVRFCVPTFRNVAPSDLGLQAGYDGAIKDLDTAYGGFRRAILLSGLMVDTFIAEKGDRGRFFSHGFPRH